MPTNPQRKKKKNRSKFQPNSIHRDWDWRWGQLRQHVIIIIIFFFWMHANGIPEADPDQRNKDERLLSADLLYVHIFTPNWGNSFKSITQPLYRPYLEGVRHTHTHIMHEYDLRFQVLLWNWNVGMPTSKDNVCVCVYVHIYIHTYDIQMLVTSSFNLLIIISYQLMLNI